MKRGGRGQRIKCNQCRAYGRLNKPFGDKSKSRLHWKREPDKDCKECKRRGRIE